MHINKNNCVAGEEKYTVFSVGAQKRHSHLCGNKKQDASPTAMPTTLQSFALLLKIINFYKCCPINQQIKQLKGREMFILMQLGDIIAVLLDSRIFLSLAEQKTDPGPAPKGHMQYLFVGQAFESF